MLYHDSDDNANQNYEEVSGVASVPQDTADECGSLVINAMCGAFAPSAGLAGLEMVLNAVQSIYKTEGEVSAGSGVPEENLYEMPSPQCLLCAVM